MGSYAPKADFYVWKSPDMSAPSGMLARSTFNGQTKFVDDDGKTHLLIDYQIKIQKDFNKAE